MITKISLVAESDEALKFKLEKYIDKLFEYAEKSKYLSYMSIDLYTFYLKI